MLHFRKNSIINILPNSNSLNNPMFCGLGYEICLLCSMIALKEISSEVFEALLKTRLCMCYFLE